MKPRLCRSTSRAFASTHPLMLPSTSTWEALLACPPSPPWNPPSFTVKSTLSSPCSRSDPPLSRQGVALAHSDSLPSYDSVLWTDALFLIFLTKTAVVYLPTALSVALRLFFSFHQAQYAQVSLLKPVPFCKPFAGLGSTKPATSHLFSYLALFSPLCPILHLSFYLNLSSRNCLFPPPVPSGWNGSPDTHFSGERRG